MIFAACLHSAATHHISQRSTVTKILQQHRPRFKTDDTYLHRDEWQPRFGGDGMLQYRIDDLTARVVGSRSRYDGGDKFGAADPSERRAALGGVVVS